MARIAVRAGGMRVAIAGIRIRVSVAGFARSRYEKFIRGNVLRCFFEMQQRLGSYRWLRCSLAAIGTMARIAVRAGGMRITIAGIRIRISVAGFARIQDCELRSTS